MAMEEDDFRNKKNTLERLEGLLRRFRDISSETLLGLDDNDTELLHADMALDTLEDFVETLEMIEGDRQALADEEE